MTQAFMLGSITSDIGKIFHPLFWVFAQALALFYAIVPNYIIAITLLTVLLMLLTAPLTVKSTKSMMEMQRIQPEFRKLQQKYKGDREKLNEEVMKLYREHGVSPLGGCLPLILQMPFFVCLYDVIKGLTNAVTVKGVRHPEPRYLSHSTRMYADIIRSGGQIKSFGIDLSQTPFQHHGSISASVPYWILFFVAIGLQYLQMARLNKRNAANIQNNPQMQTMQTMQKVTPLIFGVIYIAFPIGVTVYFIVSTVCRIVIQEILFRTGVTAPRPAGEAGARDLPARRRRNFLDRIADAQQAAQEQRRRETELRNALGSETASTADDRPGPAPPTNGARSGSKSGKSGKNGRTPTGGNGRAPRPPSQNRSGANGRARMSGGSESDDEASKAKQVPPRARDKRPRKAR